MSGYGKTQIPNVNEYASSRAIQTNDNNTSYDANRSLRDTGYLNYAQSEFGGPESQALPATYDQNGDQMPFSTSSYYQPRGAYTVAQSSILGLGSRKLPVVTSHTDKGSQGTHVYVYLQSDYDLSLPTSPNISLMFASRQCQSILTRLDAQTSTYSYVLTTDAPAFGLTGWRSPQVPLRLQLQDEAGLDEGRIEVGSYLYTDQQQQRLSSPSEMPRKRKLSSDSTEMMRVAAKRSVTQQLQTRSSQDYVADLYANVENAGYRHNSRSYTPNSLPSSYSQYDVAQSGFRKRSSTFSGGSVSSHPQLRAQTPQTPGWSSSYAAINNSGKSPALSATPASRVSSIPSPSMSANPPLIRTSTLQQSPGAATVPSSMSASGSFNPYAMYPHKAVLKINGDLDSMADNWTPDEWTTKRRIVQFWRSQNGSAIDTHFEPVAPENRPPNSICISCIWWEERQECFVTSVDTIYLLESLVAVRFTVEEKNRIRRNLEGFRPMTVSKAKSDSEDFFRIIMGFPNPKPRNIEKDVKVFPWKILAHALKKIIGKYSASYSSTASALRAPRGGVYGPTSQPEPLSSNNDYYSNSPRSNSNSGSSTYSVNLTSTSLSPSVPSQPYSESSSLQAVSAPAHSYTLSSSAMSYPYTATSSTRNDASPLVGGQRDRGSWDFSSFIETGSANGEAGLGYQAAAQSSKE